MASSGLDIPASLLAELRRHDLLLPLLRAQLIAETVGGVTLTSEDRERAMADHRSRLRLRDEAREAAHRTEHGLSDADWTWQAELPSRIRQHALNQFRAKAEGRFLERKDRLDQVTYSLLRLEDRYLAQELYLRISGGEANFPELATTYSQGPEKRQGGLVGPAPLAQAHPGLAERLRQSSPGTLLEPFRIEQWWLVVRLEKHLPAVLDESTIERISVEMFEEWVQREAVDRMTSLLRQMPDPASS